MPTMPETPMDNTLEQQQNRVAQALAFREEQDAKVAARNPLLVKEPAYIRQKMEYYRFIHDLYKKTANVAERVTLGYVRAQIRFLKAQWQPQPLHKVLFHPLVRALRQWFTGNYLVHRTQEQQLRNIQLEAMQRRSYLNISKSIAKQGLVTNIEADLKRMIALNLPSFSLPCTDTRHEHADFVLHCTKIPGTDVYYMRQVEVASRPSDEELYNGNAHMVKYTITPAEKHALSAVQAAHLVNGGMVCVEGNTWMRLHPDLKEEANPFRQVQFDLTRALKDLPLADKSKNQLQQIENGLKSGRSWEVMLEINGQSEKCVLSVSPDTARLAVKNRQGEEIKIPRQAPAAAQSMKAATQVLEKGMQEAVGKVVEMPGRRSVR